MLCVKSNNELIEYPLKEIFVLKSIHRRRKIAMLIPSKTIIYFIGSSILKVEIK